MASEVSMLNYNWRKIYDFLNEEYGLLDLSLFMDYDNQSAEIKMRQSGLIKLVNDLTYLKASIDLVGKGVSEQTQEEVKCTFDEVMKFNE